MPDRVFQFYKCVWIQVKPKNILKKKKVKFSPVITHHKLYLSWLVTVTDIWFNLKRSFCYADIQISNSAGMTGRIGLMVLQETSGRLNRSEMRGQKISRNAREVYTSTLMWAFSRPSLYPLYCSENMTVLYYWSNKSWILKWQIDRSNLLLEHYSYITIYFIVLFSWIVTVLYKQKKGEKKKVMCCKTSRWLVAKKLGSKWVQTHRWAGSSQKLNWYRLAWSHYCTAYYRNISLLGIFAGISKRRSGGHCGTEAYMAFLWAVGPGDHRRALVQNEQ